MGPVGAGDAAGAASASKTTCLRLRSVIVAGFRGELDGQYDNFWIRVEVTVRSNDQKWPRGSAGI
jgi:hypothetical protein